MLAPKHFVVKVEEVAESLQLAQHGLQRGTDGLISWQRGSNDHPRNWSPARKAFDTTVIIFLEFFVYVPHFDYCYLFHLGACLLGLALSLAQPAYVPEQAMA